jgi:glycosyltransferase involved in cell wall biosynthesis
MVKKHILFIVENNPAPYDVRVWNEALAVKKFGYDVSIISPQHKNALEKYEVIEGIKIYRHFMPHEAEGKWGFLLEYGNALLWELLLSFKVFFKQRFHYIHSANPPDHIFLIAFIFKLFGVKYIFDHHDISPENYQAKFGRQDIFYKILMVMEKLTFKTANVVISTNESYKKIAVERGEVDEKRVFVVRNGPNLEKVIFKKPNEKWKIGFDYLVSYVGVIGNQEGIENLLEAAKYIIYEKKITNIKFIIIGTGTDWNSIVSLAKEMKLGEYVHFTGFIPYTDFYEILATSDVCVNPEHRNPFTDQSTMLKIMDYMTFGKPIVMFETTEGKVTAGDAALYLTENDNMLFANSIVELLHDQPRRDKMGEISRKRIETELNWDIQKENLRKAYAFLDR